MNTLSRRHFGLCAALAVAAAALPARAQSPAAGEKKSKVFFQVSDNDPAKWGLALNNANNVQTALGADAVDIEIVAYGPGIGMLEAGSPVAPRITAALKAGTKVVACENTMKGRKLTAADMLPDIGYVASGVVELMQKEQQGYAYIRP